MKLIAEEKHGFIIYSFIMMFIGGAISGTIVNLSNKQYYETLAEASNCGYYELAPRSFVWGKK